MDKNKPMNLKFSKINKIGTMVVLARIFTDISKETSIKLLPLAKLINCDGKLIKYIDLWLKKPDKTYYHFFKGNVPDKKKKKDDPYKKKSPKKGFANSFSHDLNVMDSSVRCTIFSNGKLLISGLSSEKQRKLVLRVLSNIYIDIAQKYDKNKEIFSNDINIQYEKHNMIQHTITIDKDIHKNLMIDNLKLLKYLRKEFPYNYSYYEPKEVRSLEMIDPEQKINYMIFQKGTINVTGINKIEDVDLSIRYMVNFLNNNIHKFTMNDVVLNAIVLIEADKHAPEQKSDEWLKSRHSAVTASELAPIVGMGYKGKKMSTYVKEKVKRIKGENKFTGNIYTRKGEIYELLALHSYAYKINKDPKRKYFIIIKEVGLVKHKENNFIGASADGVVFMLSDKVKGIKYNTDPSVEQLYDWYQKDLIIGVHLIEIKCPWNYHIYDSEKCHGVKCIKIGKDEYVRQEYWCQMQQQCYVWDITMNVMSNNNFI